LLSLPGTATIVFGGRNWSKDRCIMRCCASVVVAESASPLREVENACGHTGIASRCGMERLMGFLLLPTLKILPSRIAVRHEWRKLDLVSGL